MPAVGGRLARRLIAVALLVACGGDEAPKTQPPPTIVTPETVAVATRRYIAAGPRLSGTLQPRQSASILAEIAGTVTAVNANEGQAVAPGTLLARIEDESANEGLQSARTAVSSATTAVAVARRDLERSTRLAGAGAVPRRDIDVMRAQVAGAEAQLGQAQAALSSAQDRAANQRVISEVGGVVAEKRISEGDVVAPGAPLFTVVDLSTLELEASVPTESLTGLQLGTPVEVEVRGFADQRFRGTITRISPSVDPATGQVRVYAAIANQGRRLIGGLFAEGTVASQSRQALTVPIDALDESGQTPAVMRIKGNAVERVSVQVGVRNEREGVVEILAGLNDGDRVLVGPAKTIAPGTKVTIGPTPRAEGRGPRA